MKRIAYLTIPLGILLGLTTGTTSADAKGWGHVRASCETRIFQGEDQACFSDGDAYILFEKRRVPEEEPEALAVEEQAGGFTAAGLDCGCQLRRRYDVICTGEGVRPDLELTRIAIRRSIAVIGNVDRRGRRIVGESFGGGQQTKFSLRRVALEKCEIIDK